MQGAAYKEVGWAHEGRRATGRALAIGYWLLRNEPKASSAYHFTLWKRSATVSAFWRELNAETLKKPSP